VAELAEFNDGAVAGRAPAAKNTASVGGLPGRLAAE